MSRSGMIILSIWLILSGMVMALSLTFLWMHFILGLLAIVAGVLLLWSK